MPAILDHAVTGVAGKDENGLVWMLFEQAYKFKLQVNEVLEFRLHHDLDLIRIKFESLKELPEIVAIDCDAW